MIAIARSNPAKILNTHCLMPLQRNASAIRLAFYQQCGVCAVVRACGYHNSIEFARWAAMCYAGLVPESLLKLRLRCKACHAFNSASAAPQNQANCIAQKFAWWAAMRPLLNVRRGLRCKARHALRG